MTIVVDPFALSPRSALVVFSGAVTLRWLRLLKKGFRHCFVVVEADGGWVFYNPMSTGTELAFLRGLSRDALETFFVGQGFVTVRTRTRGLERRPVPWRPFTCVEAVKRALGLRAPSVWTPWQLYCFVKKNVK